MQIIAALFMDDIELRSVPGPSTRIDLGGIQFSAAAPGPLPCTVAPHLVVIVWNPPDGKQFSALTVVFHPLGVDPAQAEAEGVEPLARNSQPLDIEPSKFNYRLVRAELPFDELGTVVAHCSIDGGEWRPVPYTLLPPVS